LIRENSKHQSFNVRLATSAVEVRIAQRLRHLIFFEEPGTDRKAGARFDRLDCDQYDAYCDHLLVTRTPTETSNPELCHANEEVIGTFRMLRQSIAKTTTGFYSQSEFDLPLLNRKPELEFLELGRSCVLATHRCSHVLELLFQGIWDYVRHNKIDVMFGCASFDGIDPEQHAECLSFLAHHTSQSADWNVCAVADRCVNMKRFARDEIDRRRVLRTLPPLIRAYMRLGCQFGQGCVIDYDFNTVDVLIVLPVATINPRYFSYYGAPTS
jgi:L-ornithine Nalpha-acyltransferase